VDVTDVTRVGWSRSRWDRVRRWLGGVGAPPSLRAQLTLMLSAFVLGGVVCALLFVGIWRHTASESDRARTAQIAERNQLRAAQRRLTAVEAILAAERSALARVRRDAAASAAKLATLRRIHASVARTLPARIAALTSTAGALVHTTATLTSELTALQAYMRNNTTTGIDPGFVNAQISYMIGSATSVSGAVAKLEQEAQDAGASAGKLGRSGK
jgi:hypothetical protein